MEGNFTFRLDITIHTDEIRENPHIFSQYVKDLENPTKEEIEKYCLDKIATAEGRIFAGAKSDTQFKEDYF